MDNDSCPFISQSCCKTDCRFWTKDKNDCIIKVVAEITLEKNEFLDGQKILGYMTKKLQSLEDEVNLNPENNDYTDFSSSGEAGSY